MAKYLTLLAVLVPILTQLSKQIDWSPGNYPKAIAVILSGAGVLIIHYSSGTLDEGNADLIAAEIAGVSVAAVGLFEFAKTVWESIKKATVG